MTAPPQRQGRPSWARTAIRRTIDTFRYVNEELLRAHEAMARPIGAPQPGRHARTTGTDASGPAGTASAPPHPQMSAEVAAEGGKPAA